MNESTAPDSMAERRQHDRVSKNLTVRYTKLEDLVKDIPFQEGELVDMGGGGLCFQASEPVNLGSQLVVVLEFPGWQAAGGKWVATKAEEDVGVLQVIGMVVWVAASREKPGCYDIGLRFSGMVAI